MDGSSGTLRDSGARRHGRCSAKDDVAPGSSRLNDPACAAAHSTRVGRRREGTSVVYFVAGPMVFKLCELVCHGARRSVQAEMAALGLSTKNGR